MVKPSKLHSVPAGELQITPDEIRLIQAYREMDDANRRMWRELGLVIAEQSIAAKKKAPVLHLVSGRCA